MPKPWRTKSKNSWRRNDGMAIEIKLPELGERVEGGDVVDIKVTPGANVREGQALVEVEAEKSTVEVASPKSGRIAKVLVKRGDPVKTGQALFMLEAEGDGVVASQGKDGAEVNVAAELPGPPRMPYTQGET